jgi:hypothetical protein
MDPATLLAIVKLARSRAALQASPLASGKDGMQRLGAQRALEQLADDLEVSAAHVGRDDGEEEA